MSATTAAPSYQDTGTTALVGIDLLSLSEPDADGVLHSLLRRLSGIRHAATHWARAGDVGHVSLSLEVVSVGELWRRLNDCLPPDAAVHDGDRSTGPAELIEPARAARDAHVGRRSGRLVHYPGVQDLVGSLTVGKVLAGSAIDRVRVLGGVDAEPHLVLVTRNHVRPAWSDGELVLTTQPAVGGTLVPFESPHPTPCCADHT